MSTFVATGAIRLDGVSLVGHQDNPTLTPGTLSWTGWTDGGWTGAISDNGVQGVLERNEDAFRTLEFSGYYIEIGGHPFAIFNSGPTWVVPFDDRMPLNDPTNFPDAPGSTTLFTQQLTMSAHCFLAGTRISTLNGDRAVEDLRPGDVLPTADGPDTVVEWVWRQEALTLFNCPGDRVPVRLRAHAFGPGQPARDLVVTADHALLLDGLLINAGALIGRGGSPYRADGPLVFHHVECDRHAAILAEGLPSESFVDYVPRHVFDNYEGYRALHGTGRPIREMDLPRVSCARLLPARVREARDDTRVA